MTLQPARQTDGFKNSNLFQQVKIQLTLCSAELSFCLFVCLLLEGGIYLETAAVPWADGRTLIVAFIENTHTKAAQHHMSSVPLCDRGCTLLLFMGVKWK